MIYADTPVPHFRFEHLSRYADRVSHLVSTRLGHGRADFTVGLNGYRPAPEVLANRQQLAQLLGLRLADMVFAQQVHADGVAVVGEAQRGKGAHERSTAMPNADALITATPDVVLVALAADCVPLLMYDPVRHVAASVHSGWRGTAVRVAYNAVMQLVKCFGVDAAHLLVGIGPSIGACCYHVGPEVVRAMRLAIPDADGLLGPADAQGNPTFDLWEANRRLLLQAGVLPHNIEVAQLCTRCHSAQFFSARTGDEGRFGAFIALR